MMKTVVVVPAYNEEKHITDVVKGARKAGFRDVIVVVDGSKDGTASMAHKAGALVLRHAVNLGKGAAMKTGAEYACNIRADAIVFVDGDGQHPPQDLKRFQAELAKGKDIVFGCRKRTKTMPLVLRFGNWFISSMIRVLYGMNLYDSQCGYRAMTIAAYKRIRWKSTDYSVESEIITLAGKRGLSYSQLEIATVYHDRYKGTTPLDGFPIVWKLFWWRFTR